VSVRAAAFALGPPPAVRIGAAYLGFEESLSAPRHVHAPDEFAGKNSCSCVIWGRWSGYCAMSASGHTRAGDPENWRTRTTRFRRQEHAIARSPPTPFPPHHWHKTRHQSRGSVPMEKFVAFSVSISMLVHFLFMPWKLFKKFESAMNAAAEMPSPADWPAKLTQRHDGNAEPVAHNHATLDASAAPVDPGLRGRCSVPALILRASMPLWNNVA
jgi:hypothetical protein